MTQNNKTSKVGTSTLYNKADKNEFALEIERLEDKIAQMQAPKKIYKAPENKKKILFAASECHPFAASGGLGEVIGSLPKALAQNEDCEVYVFMPLYGAVTEQYRRQLEFVKSFTVHLAWRQQHCGIFRLVADGVTYYFIDNEYYFKRESLYGCYDDGERFAYFCHAVLDSLPELDLRPDIIHAHDWQTGLIPVYLNTKYYYPDIKTVFTIHNIEYQGKFDLAILGDIFDLPQDAGKFVEYNGCINLMKGGIVCANLVTTVSPTYAGELKNPYFSHGLDPIINQNHYKLAGILNGIDTNLYNPQTDGNIVKTYSPLTFENKAINKTELQKLCGLPQKEDVPIIAIISRLVGHKGIELIKNVAYELLSNNDIQLIVLGKGDKEYEDFFCELAHNFKDKMCALICYDKALSHKVYAGADLFLMPSKSEPCGLSQMICSRYGTVPIVRKTGGLADSIKDCSLGSGNGFVFEAYNGQDMLSAIYRALKLYNDRQNFTALAKYIMELDFSWNKSAGEYINLYNSLFNQ